MDQVAHEARKLGISTMFGSIVPSAAGSQDMEQVMLHLGFRLNSAGHDIIYYKKSI